MNPIPDNARPTTPCDQPDYQIGVGPITCGNTWATLSGDGPECTRCHHVCGHHPNPFRWLTGPEIATLFYTPEAHNVLSACIDYRTNGGTDRLARWAEAVDRYLDAAHPHIIGVEFVRAGQVDLNLSDGTTVSIDITDPYNPTLINRS